ncbi:hypothetical protein, partial [Rhizobium johnstonii]|uniref:hypothetical protein n=1 Tax=Rhizobium johnstonii TaxID=3019933 RepID=UPI003F9CE6C2
RGFIPQLHGWSKLIKNLVFSGDGPELKSEALELITDPDPAVYGQLFVHSFGLPEETKDWFGALVGRPIYPLRKVRRIIQALRSAMR